MEEEVGKIIQVANGKIIVQIKSGSQCELCGAAQACNPAQATVRQLELPYQNEDIKIGDEVMIQFKPQIRVLSAALVFILPIFFMIAGYFIGQTIFKNEGMAVFSSFLGLMVAFLVLRIINRFSARSENFLPSIIKLS